MRRYWNWDTEATVRSVQKVVIVDFITVNKMMAIRNACNDDGDERQYHDVPFTIIADK